MIMTPAHVSETSDLQNANVTFAYGSVSSRLRGNLTFLKALL